MPIRCHNCGADNRDTARHCNACGRALTALLLPSILPSLPSSRLLPSIPPRAPVRPSVITATAVAAQPLTTRLVAAINPTTSLLGFVIDDVTERRDLPRRDWSKFMVGLAVAILIFPPLAAALITAGFIACALVLLGAGAIVTCLVLPLGLLVSMASLTRNPQRAEVPVLELRVQDQSGKVVNVEIIGRRSGGKISRGDQIEVWGHWSDKYHTGMRAWRVQIHRAVSIAGPQRAGGVVTADRPWPLAWGIIALALAIGITLLLYGGPILMGVLSSSGTP